MASRKELIAPKSIVGTPLKSPKVAARKYSGIPTSTVISLTHYFSPSVEFQNLFPPKGRSEGDASTE